MQSLLDLQIRKKRSAAREQCLERDRFKCVISGLHDWKSVASQFKGREEEIPDDLYCAELDSAYILPFSLSQWSTDKNLVRLYLLLQIKVNVDNTSFPDAKIRKRNP